MTGEVVLSAALRSNLLSLQRTQSSIDKVQSVLSTGLKVSSALDNPQNYFASQSLKNRSSDLSRLLDGIGQSIQTIKAADAGTTAISKLVDQADSIVSSARDAVSKGQLQASITGNVDFKGVSNITSILGIPAGTSITFTYYNKTTGVLASPVAVTVSANDSINQLIGKINDIGQGGYFNAKLNADGHLQITEMNGHSFNVNFSADSANPLLNAADAQFAAALGFGALINTTTRNTGQAGTNGNAEITVLASTKLTSGTFFESGLGNGIAEASDLLTSVVKTEGATGSATNSRFVNGSAGDPFTLTLRINGNTTSAAIDIQTLTIQGLVDAINTDPSVGDLVKASYDETTGKFSIEAIDATVKTVGLTAIDTVAGGASTSTLDFDFGTKTAFSPGAAANDAEGELYLLASAADTLGRLQDDYNTVRTQIDKLVNDAGYRGINLLNKGDLVTYFNEDRSNFLTTTGSDLTSSGMGIVAGDFATSTKIEAAASQIIAAKDVLRNFGSTIANSLSIIQTRETFTKSLVDTLNEGSDKLTVADQNEAGAQLLALQTRQQLGVTALSLASQAQQSVLRLFS